MRNFKELPSHQAGYTLPEIIIGVAIAGLVAAAVVSAGQELIGGTEVDGQQSKLNVIQSNLKDLYTKRASFDGLSQTAAINAGVFPTSMVSGKTAINKWNGNVTVSVTNDTQGNSNRAFEVVWGNVDEDACASMASGTNADQVSVGGTTVTDSTGQVDPAQAGQQCSGGAADITYLFNK